MLWAMNRDHPRYGEIVEKALAFIRGRKEPRTSVAGDTVLFARR
jgi:hypothetical protein